MSTKVLLHTWETWERVRIWTRKPSPVETMIVEKTEQRGIFQLFGLLGAIFTREVESRISVAKTGFKKKKKAPFAGNFDLQFKE
jgi:hypothetical protein